MKFVKNIWRFKGGERISGRDGEEINIVLNIKNRKESSKMRGMSKYYVRALTLLITITVIYWVGPAQAAGDKIVIGRVEAVSGPFKYSGDRVVLFGKEAVDEINAKGGLLGKKVVLLVEDSGFKPDVATRKAMKLILEDKVDILSGTLGSHIALAMSIVAEKNKKIFLLDNSEADSLTGTDFTPYIFRTTLTTSQRALANLSYIAKYTKFKKFYILCMDFALGREGGEAFKKYLKKKIPDAQLLGEDYHPIGLKDFGPYVTKIIASGAEVVLTMNYGPDLRNLIVTGAQLGWKAITAGSYLFDPGIMQDVKDAALGHIVAHNSLIDLGNPIERKFVKDFQERHPDLDKVLNSPCYGMLTYISYQWLFDVIKKAGSTDAEKIIKTWEGMTYDWPWGKVTMRACDHQMITSIRAAAMVRENDLFPFPYTGKPVFIPEEECTVPPAETGNPRCK
jgi:branched-chain amino acid transport system substrate-binding protein